MKRLQKLLPITLLIFSLVGSAPAGAFQFEDRAEQILAEMTPAERIGQLFIVTFEGTELSEESPIVDLILNRHISGVLLKRTNDNFVDSPQTVQETAELVRGLQELENSASNVEAEGEEASNVYIPLFIAIQHDSGEMEYTDVLSGFSDFPSQMAIGGTWNSEVAQNVGTFLGQELEAIGVNLFIGPSLDVLDVSGTTDSSGLGVRTFGGDPFWVGEMGKAFIQGIHEGSQSRIGTVVKNFPGLGGSDRSIEDEVPTIRKSLEQLKQIELAPFFEVTGAAPGQSPEVADALLVSHIRYQGFQGNIRATTRPISLDPQAFTQLLAVEPFSEWRANGGVTVSDSLGTRAIRRFVDPTEVEFAAHLVARDAFLAGNDLLVLSDFRANEDPDEYTTIIRTLDFFDRRYNEDPLFAQRVDEAVLRILNLKLRLLGGVFSLNNVISFRNQIDGVGEATPDLADVARSSATLLSPSVDEVEARIGGAPELRERIVFFTDTRRHRQCSTCDIQMEMAPDALEEAVLRLYGPSAAGQVGGWNLQSFSMAGLVNLLGQEPPPEIAALLQPRSDIEQAINAADWYVFSVMDMEDGEYGADALKLFLEQRPELVNAGKVVVFAHNIPYIMDPTNISKVDLLYALYDTTDASIDTAARLLFLEIVPTGASPVSVPGVGYDLISMTSPDPEQVISLTIGSADSEAEGEPPGFTVGDVAEVTTGPIIDRNGNPVPDGTVAEFQVTQGEGIPPLTVRSITTSGIARLNLALDRTGLFSISASSEPAVISEILQLNVQQDVLAQPTVISPTLQPTETPSGTAEEELPIVEVFRDLNFLDFLLSMVAVAGVGGVGYLSSQRLVDGDSYRVRCVLLPVLGGLLAYNYIAIGLPGSQEIISALGYFAGIVAAIVGGAIGLFVAQLWCRAQERD